MVNSQNTMKRRNPNVEILRCFLMFCIVLGHCSLCCYENVPVSRVIDTFVFFAVNCFAFISGWYGIKTTGRRVLNFLGYGLFASLVVWGISFWTLPNARFVYSLGWFGNAYLGLMVVAPFVNAGFNSLRGQSDRNVFYAWLLYAALMCIAWLHLDQIGLFIRPGGWVGHSFNTLLFMYVTGRVLSCSVRLERLKKSLCIGGWLSVEGLVVALTAIGFIYKGRYGLGGIIFDAKVADYQSPLMWLAGVTCFLTFYKAKFPGWLGNWCAFLGPSMFIVYLIHDAVNRAAIRPAISSLEIKVVNAVPGAFQFRVAVATIIAACVVFVLCIIADLLRRVFLKFVRSR